MAATIASPSVRGTNSPSPAARPSLRRAMCCARRGLPIWRGSTIPRSARCLRKAPVKRIGRARFVRNVLIAIGNSGDAALAAEAERLLDDVSPLVRGAAVWALSRLDPAGSNQRGESLRRRESDPEVVAEWAAAQRAMSIRNDHAYLFRLRLLRGTFCRGIRRQIRPHHRHRARRRTRRDLECLRGRTAAGARVRRPAARRRS